MRGKPTLFVQAGRFHFNPDHIVAFSQSFIDDGVRVWTTRTYSGVKDGSFLVKGTVEEFRDLLFKAGCDVYFTDGGSVSR